MAQAQTATAKSNGAERAKRGSGPVQITYIDSKGVADHKRVPMDAVGVRLAAGGKHWDYDASKFNPEVKNVLAVYALAVKVKTQVANHGEDDGSNANELAGSVYSDMLTGKLYSKGEGKARGRAFDAAIYAEALRAMYAFCAKKGLKNKAGKAIVALNDGQVGDFKMQLEAMSPKERTEKIKALSQNGIYKKALAELKTKAIEVDTDNMDAMPF